MYGLTRPMMLLARIADEDDEHLEPVGPEERRDPPDGAGATLGRDRLEVALRGREPAAVAAATGATGPGHGAHAATSEAHRAEPSTGTLRALPAASRSTPWNARGTMAPCRPRHRPASTPRPPPGCSTPRTRRSAGSRSTGSDSWTRPVPERPPITEEPWVKSLLREPARPDGSPEPLHPYQKWGGVHWRLAWLAELDVPGRRPGGRPGRRRGVRAGRGLAGVAGPPRDRPTGRRASPDPRVAGGARGAGRRSATGWPASRAWRGSSSASSTWQWPDGGWNCDRHPACRHSSFNESWGPLRALAAYAAAAPSGACASAGDAAGRRGPGRRRSSSRTGS